MKLVVVARSDVGQVRAGNEDSFLVGEHGATEGDGVTWFAVADGMGGHQAGEVASATAVKTLLLELQSGQPVALAVSRANTQVFSRAEADPDLRGMGTTLTAATFDGERVRIGHVGDSRAYLWRDGSFRQVTTDHSLVAELIAVGELTPEQAEVDPRRSMITRALGIGAVVDVDSLDLEVMPGDRILLCSDGLTTMVRDDDIAEVLRRHRDPARVADVLVAAANAAGGEDNVTVLVADVVADEVDEVDEPDAAPAPVAPAAPAAPVAPAPETPATPATPETPETPVARPGPGPGPSTEPGPTSAADDDPTDPEGIAPIVVDDADFADALDTSALPAPVERRRWWRRHR